MDASEVAQGAEVVRPNDWVIHPEYGSNGRVDMVTNFGPTVTVQPESRVVVRFSSDCTAVFRADDLTFAGGPHESGFCVWQARAGSGSIFS